MALDTLSHTPVFNGQSIQIFDLPMTFPASNFAVDVALMIEQYMLCHVIHFYPGRRRLRIEVAMLDLDPGMVDNYIFMTVQAFFNSRYSGVIGIRHIRVAVLALNLFDPAVNIMTEWDGLLRSDKNLRRRVK